MTADIAYQHGNFLPRSDMSISLDEPGFVLGITVSERLRTFDGKLFRFGEHLERLKTSLQITGVACRESDERIGEITDRIVAENQRMLPAGRDLGVVILCAPDSMKSSYGQLRIYSYPLVFRQWADLYSKGQRLVISRTTQVPSSCWPSELKCRSRMHYYLADREASRRDKAARALLLDLDGFVTEASTANVFAYFGNEGIVSPPPDKIISGISLAVVAELSRRLGMSFSHRDIRPAELLTAKEVLLCSTSPCIHPVSTIDGNLIHKGQPGEVFQTLMAAWSQEVGIDIVRQAESCQDDATGL